MVTRIDQGGTGRRAYRALLLVTLLLLGTRLGYSVAEFLLPLAQAVPQATWLRLAAGVVALLVLRSCAENFLAEAYKVGRNIDRQDTGHFVRSTVILLARHGLAWCALVACVGILFLA